MEHPIWKIGLFIQLDKERAKCIECNIRAIPVLNYSY